MINDTVAGDGYEPGFVSLAFVIMRKGFKKYFTHHVVSVPLIAQARVNISVYILEIPMIKRKKFSGQFINLLSKLTHKEGKSNLVMAKINGFFESGVKVG
jgi:hypothetical protein